MIGAPSRQAYQALKSLATHKTDRSDAPGLAHLARTGFFKPVHVKSLQAHALRSLVSARKKLVGQRVTLENQIRGLAVVFGVRLPRALAAGFIDNALRASEGIAGLSAAMRGLIAARTAVMTAVAAIDADMRRMTRAFVACRRLNDLIAQNVPILLERDNASARLISIRSASERAASHHGAR
jgi:transposase